MARRFGAVMVPVAVATVFVPVDLAAASPTCKGLDATIMGGPAPERLEGTRGRDVIHAGPGDDEVLGLGGDDVVCGGPGADAVSGGAGDDRVFGNDDVDVLAGGPGSDFVDGGKGHDVALFESAKRGLRIDLRTGVATGQGNDRLDGIESTVGGEGGDVIRGTQRANLIAGGVGDDRLLGLGGDDVVQPLDGDDYADGGRGKDLLSYSLANGAVAIDPVDGDGTERLRSFEALQGSRFPDVIAGTKGDDVLMGWSGGDQFRPRGGDDFVDGEAPLSDSDYVLYDDSPRPITLDLQVLPDARVGKAVGHGTDILVRMDGAVGSRFDDAMAGRGPRDWFEGRGGDDTLIVREGGTASGGDGADVLIGTGHLSGDDGNDELSGRSQLGGGRFEGGAGDDVLTGRQGPDVFVPGPGDDTVSGGHPTDATPDVHLRQDTVSYAGAENAVVVQLAAGTATGEGTDTLDDVEHVEGSAFDDVVEGTESTNVVSGGEGADRLDGLGGLDAISGGSGDDVMSGGDGDDTLVGDDGADTADGGPGDDACGAEQVTNCESAPARRAVTPPRVSRPRAALPAWSLALQASRWERHLRKISHAMTEAGKVTSPASPISEFRNRIRLIDAP